MVVWNQLSPIAVSNRCSRDQKALDFWTRAHTMVVTCDCPSGKAALGSEGFHPMLDLPLRPATAWCQAHTLIGLGLWDRPTSSEQAGQVLLEPGHGRCHQGFSTSPQMHQQPRWLVHGWLLRTPDQTRKTMLPGGSWRGAEGQLGHPASPRQHDAAPHRC